MPRYEFVCDDCGEVVEEYASIKDGPPKDVTCPNCIGAPMRHVLGGHFVLKGEGWPGKDAKKREYASASAKEKNDQEFADMQREQRIVDEVTDIRRCGRQATARLQKDNPQKWKDYRAAMKKGVRAKSKKKKGST